MQGTWAAFYIPHAPHCPKNGAPVLEDLRSESDGELAQILEIVYSHREAFASAAASAIENFSAVLGFHPFAKSTCGLSFSFARLVCALHCSIPLTNFSPKI